MTLLGLLIRFYFKDYVSGDARGFLLPWYDAIKAKGSHSLSEQVGDYNILYQFIIYVFTLLPLKPLYAYKILSVIFDYLLAIIVALIVDGKPKVKLLERIKSNKFLGAYTAILFCPLVLLNSSCWAQCDSIYTFFIFASLYAFIREKYSIMFMLYGIAFSFKFQAVFVLPFMIILYLVEKRFSISYFLIIPFTLIISALPGILMGRSIFDPFLIYMRQTGTYNAVSMNYDSFWNCIGGWSGINNDYSEFKVIASVLTVVLLGGLLLWTLKSEFKC